MSRKALSTNLCDQTFAIGQRGWMDSAFLCRRLTVFVSRTRASDRDAVRWEDLGENALLRKVTHINTP